MPENCIPLICHLSSSFFWPPTPFHSKVPIAVHSSAIYPDPISLAPTQFHSKAPNSSLLIYHLYRSNLFGPYSIPLKCPKFKFTHLPFIQLQSFWPLLHSSHTPQIAVHSSAIYPDPIFITQMPQIEVHSSTIYINPIFLAPTPFHSYAANCSSLICHLSRSNHYHSNAPNCSPLICHLSRSILAPTPFYSKVPIAVHSSAIYPDPICLTPTPFQSKAPNSSSLIYHLYRPNLIGLYSIPHKCPKFQFTHLPFTQIQSFGLCSIPLKFPKLKFTHLPFIQL